MAGYGRELIEKNFNTEKEKWRRIVKNYARAYDDSMVYYMDIESNINYFNNIQENINTFKSNIRGIFNWIDRETETTALKKVSNKLENLSNNISLDETKGIKDKIRVASEEVYNEYLKSFQDNYRDIDRYIETVEQDLSRANTLEKKIESEECTDDDKLEYKSRLNDILSRCSSMVNKIRNANSLNEKILEKGLKKRNI